jgi:hypothetical protein
MRKNIFGVLALGGLVSCSSNTSSQSNGARNAGGPGQSQSDDGGSDTNQGSSTSTGSSAGGFSGDGSSGGLGSCGDLGGGTMTWLLNGQSECTTLVETTRTTDSAMDFLEIVGSTATGVGIGLTVASYSGPLSGSYTCSPTAVIDGGPTVIFVYGGVNTIGECTITITQAGGASVNAQGTFSATGTFLDGGTANITDGTFDVSVMVTDGG